MWQMAAACPADLAAAAAAGDLTSRAAPPSTNRRRISTAMFSSPRANALARAMAARGRTISGFLGLKQPQDSARHNRRPTQRQGAGRISLGVCGDPTFPIPTIVSQRRTGAARESKPRRKIRREPGLGPAGQLVERGAIDPITQGGAVAQAWRDASPCPRRGRSPRNGEAQAIVGDQRRRRRQRIRALQHRHGRRRRTTHRPNSSPHSTTADGHCDRCGEGDRDSGACCTRSGWTTLVPVEMGGELPSARWCGPAVGLTEPCAGASSAPPAPRFRGQHGSRLRRGPTRSRRAALFGSSAGPARLPAASWLRLWRDHLIGISRSPSACPSAVRSCFSSAFCPCWAGDAAEASESGPGGRSVASAVPRDRARSRVPARRGRRRPHRCAGWRQQTRCTRDAASTQLLPPAPKGPRTVLSLHRDRSSQAPRPCFGAAGAAAPGCGTPSGTPSSATQRHLEIAAGAQQFEHVHHGRQ